MRFTDLISLVFELDICPITARIFGDPDREIRHIRYLDGSAPDFRPDTLYVGLPELVPELPAPDESVNLLCCGGGAVPVRPLGSRGLNYLQVQNPDAAPLFYDRLRLALAPRPAEELRDMQRLTEALLSGRGLQHMADVAGEVFGNPMRISDMSYKYLVRLNMDSSPDPILQEFIDGRPSKAHVDFGQGRHLRERQRDLRFPVYHPVREAESGPNILGTAMLSAAVFIQNVVVGYCTLYDAWRPYRMQDYALLEHFCRLVALEMQKDSYFSKNKDTIYSYFLRDLLSGNLCSPQTLKEQLHLIGWYPKMNLYLLAAELPRGESLPGNPSVIAQQLHRMAGDNIYVVLEDAIVLLLSRESHRPLETAALESFLADMNLQAGLSACFTNLLEAPRHLESARRATVLGTHAAPGRHLHRFSDHAVSWLLAEQDTSLLLNALADGAIPKLLAHDREQEPPLVPTLQAWLDSDLSSSGAAAALGIHKNTLLYRLEKIRSITGLSLSGGEEHLQLLLALKLLNLS